MLVVAKDLQTQYEKALDSASISRELRPQFRKWLRFYLDFCAKYGHSPGLKSSLPLFMAKLASKNQAEAKRSEASVAVTLTSRWPIRGRQTLYPRARPNRTALAAREPRQPERRRSLRSVKRREIIPRGKTVL